MKTVGNVAQPATQTTQAVMKTVGNVAQTTQAVMKTVGNVAQPTLGRRNPAELLGLGGLSGVRRGS